MKEIGINGGKTENTENSVAHGLFAAMKRLHKAQWQKGVEGHKPSEMTLMICIEKWNHSDEEGLKVSEISRLLGFTPPTITQLINSLEAKQMVERRADPSDRRVVRVKLTESGKELTRKAEHYRDVMLDKLVQHLGEKDTKQLTELLLKVHEYVEDNPPPDWDRLQMNGDEKLD
ncbi:MarR family transcriptional regulator [Paenibacillus sp. FSL E2-0202]|uniref:MarR family winged helix-turn-helix transcriptional regulator n=1 Tax=Paenibacillus sp. FSL E2-0202 TaxID=2954505 RepID=UPI0030ED298F